MNKEKITAIIYAFLAALFYAINIPCSKVLLNNVDPTFMAGFLYLGAGIGVGIMYLFHYKKETETAHLCKKDLPYAIGMILLDIIAPILLMIGVSLGTSSNSSLLGNFEIVATTLIAMIIFRENVSGRLWLAISLITLSSIILTFDKGLMEFSVGSLFVLGATVCWGFENNCTKNISDKSTYQIVTIKGICSGTGSLIIAFILSEKIPNIRYILLTLALGFVAYGLSIFTYIRAQNTLGAAKTSAYYAASPFIGVLFSFLFLHEMITVKYIAALIIMMLGTAVIVYDTLIYRHNHSHQHILTHTHNGITHTHIVVHSHSHNHLMRENNHSHTHSPEELEKTIHHHKFI